VRMLHYRSSVIFTTSSLDSPISVACKSGELSVPNFPLKNVILCDLIVCLCKNMSHEHDQAKSPGQVGTRI
jgi:hypothetical protein